jgi:creatinine amidohydrolase
VNGRACRVFRYDEMTWPEIARLPRDLPLVVPLGLGVIDLAQVAERLGQGRLVLLPAIPFGFPRPDALGALAPPRSLVRRVLLGIQEGLTLQGFEQVVFVDGYAVGPSLDEARLTFLPLPSTSSETWVWPGDLAGRVVVVSLGHTEQHGHHLPTGTDTFIAQALADGLAQAIPEEVVCLPAWPYGASTHTREFPATLNLGGRTFEDFFLAMTGRLVRLGARMIYFSNAHGGNHSYLVNVIKHAGERWPQAFVATEWLHTTGPALHALRESSRGGMGHAGELETSYLLHLRPDLVQMNRATVETDFIATPNYYMDWIEGGRLIANPPWHDDTTRGVYGDPTSARAEKGRLWLEAAVQERLEIVAELRTQHQRRQVRRLGRASEPIDRA